MRRALVTSILAVCLSCAPTVATPTDAPTASPPSPTPADGCPHEGRTCIRGVVANAQSGAPLAGICVQVGAAPACYTTTGSDGAFAIELDRASAVSWTVHLLRGGTDLRQLHFEGPFATDTVNAGIVEVP